MKVVSAINVLVFSILACIHLFQTELNAAQHCLLMAMMWAIYLKLLCMEEKE